MCNAYTESGKPCRFDGCESYKLAQAALTAAQLRYGDLDMETTRIRSDRDRLAGVVVGMEDQGQRNLDALRRAEDANAELRQGKVDLHAMWVKQVEENARLREFIGDAAKAYKEARHG